MIQLTDKIVFDVLRNHVKERYRDVLEDPVKITMDRWNLSNFFYKTRKDLDEDGYDITPLNDKNTNWRSRIYSKVRVICEKELGIKRHEAGIFPAERAVMAFRGELFHIGFDNIQRLRFYGPDIIMIEKEGIVEKLLPFTQKLGIALIHSQGFYSEYAEMLANEAIGWGGNVGILTDFDAAGINIGLKIKGPVGQDKVLLSVGDTKINVEPALYKNIPKRLGIDYETLQYLGIPISDVQENSLNKNDEATTHWLGLFNTLNGKKKRNNEDEWTVEQFKTYFPYLQQKCKYHDKIDDEQYETNYIYFLKTWRVELDTVINIVGPQKFWEWLEKRILETFETRDYTRAVTVPRYVLTPTMLRFQEKLVKAVEKVLEEPYKKEADKLRAVYDFIDVDKKQNEIEKDFLENYLLKDNKVNEIDTALKALIKEKRL